MNEIKKINVGGVDYDIVSESAEKKIAELEKNNTALANITFGSRSASDDLIKVGLGKVPDYPEEADDIVIGKGTRIGESVKIGSEYPVSMEWNSFGCFCISSNGGNRGTITIGSNVNIQAGSGSGSGSGSGNAGISGEVRIDSNSILHMSSSTISIYDSHLNLDSEGLHFGTQDGHIGNNVGIALYGEAIELGQGYRSICRFFADACDIYIGTKTDDYRKGLIVREGCSHILEIGNGVNIGESVHIGAHVAIGGNLSSEEHLNIQGPVFLEAKNGETALTIGTDVRGCLKIDWGGNDKIVFTNLNSGKKATLTLS